MLLHLSINDYLLIPNLSLDFHRGLTVLTGQTGAGKSIVLGAIDVLLGQPFPQDAIYKGSERAILEGVFSVDDPDLTEEFLDREDVEEGRTSELTVRRELSVNGRTRTYLNDRPIPRSTLQRLRDYLADFHGQREHQALFNPVRQLEYLDAFAGTGAQAAAVADLYAGCASLSQKLTAVQEELHRHRMEQSLLSYQLEEIERLGLKAGEEEEISNRLSRLESAEKLTGDAAGLIELVSDGDESLAVLSGRARRMAGEAAALDPQFAGMAEELTEIEARIKDVAEQIRDYAESLTIDEEELERLRERRSVIWELKRKHGLDVEQILERAAEMRSLLERGEELQRTAGKFQSELEETQDRLKQRARELSQKRKHAAEGFARKVTAAMKPLGFSKAVFEIRVRSTDSDNVDKITRHGSDTIDFLFTANPDSGPLPLSSVASGGESSRTTLAIKSVLADRIQYPLMVYDEIDSGISGRVADQVGQALAVLAKRHQVLVITHLPQIASRADHHLAVTKTVERSRTRTTVKYVTGDERVTEIAALLAGTRITDKALASAGELLRAAEIK